MLLAYAKRSLYPKVLASAIPDDPALDPVLRGYFPRRIVEATGELYREHRLRREIVATFVTNDVVNSLGIAWAWQMMAETGAEAAEVVRAYWIAREVTGAVARWEEVEALFADPAVDTDVQMEVMVGVDGLVEGVSRWYLQHANEGDAASVIARDRASFSELSQTLRGVGSDAWRADHALQREALAARGAAAAAGRGRGLALRAHLRARRDRRRAGDRLLAGRGRATRSSPSASGSTWTGWRSSSAASPPRRAGSAGRWPRCATSCTRRGAS